MRKKVETYWSFYENMQADDTPNPLAKEELNLLARLMGSMKAGDGPPADASFGINLFATDQEEEEAWVICSR